MLQRRFKYYLLLPIAPPLFRQYDLTRLSLSLGHSAGKVPNQVYTFTIAITTATALDWVNSWLELI
jgi:hypothetical protein